MHITNKHERILALDARPQRLGYAVFAGPDTLLDWGLRMFRGGINAVRVPFRHKVAQLISEWQPDKVILNEPRSARAIYKVKAVQVQAGSFDVPVILIGLRAVREAFRDHRNKDDRARALVARFPELSSRLPPRRKLWKSEDRRLSIFDAVALGVINFEADDIAISGLIDRDEPFRRLLG
jgi:hypothetical protein